ncbi:hypothetical protein C4829_24890, partial [Salmonella enterica subsp. enterica serovar Rubislaw]
YTYWQLSQSLRELADRQQIREHTQRFRRSRAKNVLLCSALSIEFFDRALQPQCSGSKKQAEKIGPIRLFHNGRLELRPFRLTT